MWLIATTFMKVAVVWTCFQNISRMDNVPEGWLNATDKGPQKIRRSIGRTTCPSTAHTRCGMKNFSSGSAFVRFGNGKP